jgi:cytochrome c oxidase cbb3-type subunit 2
VNVPEPPADLATLTARGAEVYANNQCSKCHGTQGKGDGPSAATLHDDWDFPIRATDLSYPWSFKGGHRPEDIYRTIVTGLSGTPMPSYGDATPDIRDRWALVAFVLSLSPPTRPVLHLDSFPTRVRLGPDGRVLTTSNEGKGGPG